MQECVSVPNRQPQRLVSLSRRASRTGFAPMIGAQNVPEVRVRGAVRWGGNSSEEFPQQRKVVVRVLPGLEREFRLLDAHKLAIAPLPCITATHSRRTLPSWSPRSGASPRSRCSSTAYGNVSRLRLRPRRLPGEKTRTRAVERKIYEAGKLPYTIMMPSGEVCNVCPAESTSSVADQLLEQVVKIFSAPNCGDVGVSTAREVPSDTLATTKTWNMNGEGGAGRKGSRMGRGRFRPRLWATWVLLVTICISLYARQVFDGRGLPTVEVDLQTELGLFRATAPTYASPPSKISEGQAAATTTTRTRSRSFSRTSRRSPSRCGAPASRPRCSSTRRR